MEKQAVIEIGANREIKITKKPVWGDWLYEEKSQRAWHCLSKTYAWFGLGKEGLGLVLDTRFSKPLNPYAVYEKEELEELTNLDKKAAESLTVAIGQAEKESSQSIIAWGVAGTVSAIVFVLLVLAILFASGKLGGAS